MTREERSAAGRLLPWRHRLIAAVVVTVVVVSTGVLARNGTAGPRPRTAGTGTSTASSGTPTASPGAPPSPPALTADHLLRTIDLRRLGPGPWRVVGTGTASPGVGPGSTCRRGRVADPSARSGLVRTFRSAVRPSHVARQSVEVSASSRGAARAYRTTLSWFAGCRAARLQLLDAHPVDGVGDRAEVLTLRWWRAPATTLDVAVARVGTVTTSTVSVVPGATRPRPAAQALALASSVARLCPVARILECRHHPVLREGPLPSDGTGSRLLAAVDLPPVGAVDRPWVGTRPVEVHSDRPTTSCDRVSLVTAGARSGHSRTFLVPGAHLPPRFGLTETFGAFSTDRGAARFVAALRASVAGCQKRDLATRVGPERRVRRSAAVEASAWDLSTSLSATRTVRFRLGVVRVGSRVARLTFTPATGGDMTAAAFDALLQRAGERLR